MADFGIARAVDAAGEKLTQTGMAVGTPHYMSPEQALGADHADGRSDVYSLGCVLYELLAGQPPFDGPNSRAILARHAMEQVPSIRIVRQSVPEELEDVVLQALEKTPADRFQKMSEMADILADLEPTVATRRTTSRGVPAIRRSTSGGVPAVRRTTPVAILGAKWGTGARLWSILAALLILVVGGGVVVWRFGFGGGASAAQGPSVDKNSLAVLYFEKAPGSSDSLSYLADGLTEALIRELGGVKGLQVISSNGVRPYRAGDTPLQRIAQDLKVGTLVQGNIAQSGDRLRLNVSLVDAGSGVELGSRTLERPRAEIFALQDDLAKEVSVFLRQRLGQAIEVQKTQVGTRSTEAWELVQRAEQLTNEVDPLLAAADTAAAARRLVGADSLLAQAERRDAKWVAPIVKRGWLAYRQLDLIGSFDKAYYSNWLDVGMGHAGRALELDPKNADAFEIKGILEYWRWLLNLEPDQSKAAKLVASAEQDLRAAVEGNSTAAFAWTLLSHLLMGQSQTGEAKLAALKAYEADPYLTSAKQTVWRLFQASLDLEDRQESTHWCNEGRRRFPEYNRFTECQLWLFALKGVPPDIPKAWQLVDEYERLSPPNQRTFQRLTGQMLVALALARAGLADSARAVAVRSRGDAELDPTRELALLESLVRIMVDDRDEALRQLSTYVATNPQFRASLAKDQTWWFQGLRDDPRFKALTGTGG